MMRQREKEKFTYGDVQLQIRKHERVLANKLENLKATDEFTSLNTTDTWQLIGALKILKLVLWD